MIMLIQYIEYIKVTVGTSGPGYHSKCQLKWSNLASEAHGELHGNLQAHRPETYRKLHGNLEPVGSCSPGWARTSLKGAPAQAGQARARKFLKLSGWRRSFLLIRGTLAEFRGGLAEADAVTCTVHWRPQWRRAGRGVDVEKKEKEEEEELHRC